MDTRIVSIEVHGEDQPVVFPVALLERHGYVVITVATSASDPNPRTYELKHFGNGSLKLVEDI